jgi:hypothetical protein
MPASASRTRSQAIRRQLPEPSCCSRPARPRSAATARCGSRRSGRLRHHRKARATRLHRPAPRPPDADSSSSDPPFFPRPCACAPQPLPAEDGNGIAHSGHLSAPASAEGVVDILESSVGCCPLEGQVVGPSVEGAVPLVHVEAVLDENGHGLTGGPVARRGRRRGEQRRGNDRRHSQCDPSSAVSVASCIFSQSRARVPAAFSMSPRGPIGSPGRVDGVRLAVAS